MRLGGGDGRVFPHPKSTALPNALFYDSHWYVKLKHYPLSLLLKAGPADLRHFDPAFTQEAVSSSIIRSPDFAASSSSTTDAFLGFSYAPNDES